MMSIKVRRVLLVCACLLLLFLGVLVLGRRAVDHTLISKVPDSAVPVPRVTSTVPVAPSVSRPKVVAPADRQRAAERLEQRVRSEGLDVRVSTSGGNSTTLQVNYALLSRALIFAVMHNEELTGKLKSVGFEEVRFDSGSKSWTEPLK